MAYRKRSTRRKTFKRKSYKKRPASFASSAISALSGFALNKLKSKLGLNTESHWVDTIESIVGTGSTCTAMAYPLTIPIGDSVNSRTGNSVRLTSYNAFIRISANAAAVSPTFVRVLFVKVKDVRGATIGPLTFLDSATRLTSMYNMGDSTAAQGYSVLFDKTYTINIATSDSSEAICRFTYKPLVHHLKWDSSDTTGAAGSLSDGFIRGFIMTSETGANTPNYSADHRVKFVDN